MYLKTKEIIKHIKTKGVTVYADFNKAEEKILLVSVRKIIRGICGPVPTLNKIRVEVCTTKN